MGAVMVLHAVLHGAPPAGRAGALLERLPYAYRLELERRDPAARAASLRGLELLCEGVARLRGSPVELPRLRIAAEGKPYLEDGPWFSISHATTRVAVALSEQCELGLDLEDRAAGGAQLAALDRWTALEAALKAVGAGLRQARAVHLSPDLATAVIGGVTVHTRRVMLGPDAVARLATREPVDDVRVVEGRSAAPRGPLQVLLP